MKSKSSSKGEKLKRVQASYPFFFFWINIIFTLMRLPRDPQFSSLDTYPVTMKYHIFLENGIKELIQGREMMTMYMLLSLFSPFGSILFLLTVQYLS